MAKPNRLFPAWKKSKKGERIPGERAPQKSGGLPKNPFKARIHV